MLIITVVGSPHTPRNAEEARMLKLIVHLQIYGPVRPIRNAFELCALLEMQEIRWS